MASLTPDVAVQWRYSLIQRLISKLHLPMNRVQTEADRLAPINRSPDETRQGSRVYQGRRALVRRQAASTGPNVARDQTRRFNWYEMSADVLD